MNQGLLPLRREFYTPNTPLSRYHKAARITLMKQTGEHLLTARKQERNVTFLNNLYRNVNDLWEFSVKVAEVRGMKGCEGVWRGMKDERGLIGGEGM